MVPIAVFPANAGMNRLERTERADLGRVPRKRGDEPSNMPSTNLAPVVFPANAGMNRSARPRSVSSAGVPRKRGDEPARIEAAETEEECSPQTRG